VIAWLEGLLREKSPTRILLQVGGVGYELLISLRTFERLPDCGKTLSLHVRTVVREDSFLLYGFATSLERASFDLLQKASRVGPKLAQAILSGIDAERLLMALQQGDVDALRRVPGVGAKTAERMGVELREAAALLRGSVQVQGEGQHAEQEAETDQRDQLLSALLNLGYPRSQAERVMGAAAREAGEQASIEELIRIALRRLAR